MKMSEGGVMLWGGLGGACVHPGAPEAQSPFPHATLGGLDGARDSRTTWRLWARLAFTMRASQSSKSRRG